MITFLVLPEFQELAARIASEALRLGFLIRGAACTTIKA
jgi:hypothetical protein